MEAAIQSGVFEQRKVKSVTLTIQEVRDAPSSLWRRKVNTLWTLDNEIPAHMKDMMAGKRTWSSPSPLSLCRGAAAFEWLRYYHARNLTGTYNIDCVWLNKLLPRRAVIHPVGSRARGSLVLVTCEYGALTWSLDYHDNDFGKYYTMRRSGSPVDWTFVLSLDSVTVVDYVVRFIPSEGIVLMVSEVGPQSFVVAAMLKAYVDNTSLRRLISLLGGAPQPAKSSRSALANVVCSLVGDDHLVAEHVIARFENSPAEDTTLDNSAENEEEKVHA